MKNILSALCILSLIGAMACGQIAAPSPNDNPTDTGLTDTDNLDADLKPQDTEQTDTSQPDFDTTSEDTNPNPDDDVNDCIPTTPFCAQITDEKPGDGSTDDGCGDTIHCLPSDCLIIDDHCGPEDLGVLITCPNQEEAQCHAPSLDKDGEDHIYLYVDPNTDAEEQTGEKDEPFKTLENAFDAAQTLQRVGVEESDLELPLIAIIVAGDDTTVFETTSLEIIDGVSLIAGYNSQFERSLDHRPTLHITTTESTERTDIVGLTAKNIEHPTLIHGFHIKTDDATQGFSNYGIHIVDSHNLTLQNITLQTGKAGDGKAGEDGENGENGQNGQNSTEAKAGNGGQNASNCEPGYTQGGNGGQGGIPAIIGIFDKDEFPTSGSPAEEAEGGLNGNDPSAVNGDGKNGGDAPVIHHSPTHGKPGKSGGTVIENMWVPDGHGTSAENGAHGTGGGGGGGGAIIGTGINKTKGHSGGGGGAGGCAGIGGKGGEAGSGSFGMLLINSDIKIQGSIIRANSGGDGGNGGNGGNGGKGGKGGSSTSTKPPRGGKGGNGSDGTAGGHGGGGAGGVSYGVYCHDATLDADPKTTFHVGPQSHGGKSDAPGGQGEVGITEKSFGCNL